ncbi:hypothetical protein [Methylocapsa palsarum]|uniref:ATP synthase subunit b n=1 Tax=Methylocapsa palsarum TaxID=1612308 RepID=A0A1I4CTD0_9HYPH|nr:hypothetical protein [Methylocapsa palsarum]SFK84155.1 F-type H+-transporting ATPase subunit b [Methylocapsa palsarum]
MLIDWFTVGAQALNFLILVWLLKRFLYKPILRAIDEREKRIAGELADAATQKAEAQQEREEFRRKNDALDKDHARLMDKAAAEAESEGKRLLNQARTESDEMRAKLLDSLQNEHLTLTQALVAKTQQEVFAIARKTLEDLAATSLEERMADVFVSRLHALSEAEKAALSPAGDSRDALIRSVYVLPPTQRALIEAAVKETIGAATQCRFVVAPDLISGIELTFNGFKLAWSIADYLASFEKSVGSILQQPKPDGRASRHAG